MVSVAKPWLICGYHDLTTITMCVFFCKTMVIFIKTNTEQNIQCILIVSHMGFYMVFLPLINNLPFLFNFYIYGYYISKTAAYFSSNMR